MTEGDLRPRKRLCDDAVDAFLDDVRACAQKLAVKMLNRCRVFQHDLRHEGAG